jgi:hypothetical protein
MRFKPFHQVALAKDIEEILPVREYESFADDLKRRWK